MPPISLVYSHYSGRAGKRSHGLLRSTDKQSAPVVSPIIIVIREKPIIHGNNYGDIARTLINKSRKLERKIIMANNQEIIPSAHNGRPAEIHSGNIDVPVHYDTDIKTAIDLVFGHFISAWRCIGTTEVFLNYTFDSEESITPDGKHLNTDYYLGYRNNDQKGEMVIKTNVWTNEGRRYGAIDQYRHDAVHPIAEHPIDLIRKAIRQIPGLHHTIDKKAKEYREFQEEILFQMGELKDDLPDDIIVKIGCSVCGGSSGIFRDLVELRKFWKNGMCQHCLDHASAQTSPNKD
jgi:hypothetical protein